MKNGTQNLNQILGNLAAWPDRHVRGITPKLDSVGDDQDARFFMLATYCFDLTRKLKYQTLMLQEFLKDADPAWAKRIRDDQLYIDPAEKNLSWKEMARRAEETMQRLWRECDEAGYGETLDELAAKAETGQEAVRISEPAVTASREFAAHS